jgi:hypothetical protein
MTTLTGALLAVWIAACILIAIFLSVLALSGLVCTFSNSDTGVPRLEAFSGFVCCSIIAGLFFIHVHHLVTKPQETPETPRTRDILLTVPEESSVNAQVTSGNNTVNLQNL